ncbi:DUF4238 domain-containing protein [Wohlfahrtiimonas chitiniclastica]|uniref:DUF4238 domain-containing protein n=1 Tax=Wohlfahrtiimonas chitiniclastica TaxID=400946 RepID=UPI001BD0CDA8|nr:DUF4238 domain-containing protein [Wohlfahrtiimonas chitiniclastica]MBS7821121.1 DUF4238 domain-containing protein [Wohlfahrtiimonas chitiniclastica]
MSKLLIEKYPSTPSDNLQTMIDIFESNSIENHYSDLESDYIAVLDKIRDQDSFELSWSDYENLCTFAAHQLTRSLKVQKNQNKILEDYVARSNISDMTKNDYHNCSVFFVIIFKDIIASTMINQYCNITLVRNTTSTRYITNDAPVFNHLFGETKSRMEFLVPISPSLLLKYECIKKEKAEVDELNNLFRKDREQNNQELYDSMLNGEIKKPAYQAHQTVNDILFFQENENDEESVKAQNKLMDEYKNENLIAFDQSDLEVFRK